MGKISFFIVVVLWVMIGFSITAEKQQNVGSVHVAVIGVARWSDVASQLQPKFIFTEENALSKAIPTTLAQYQELLDSIKIALRLAPPTSATTSEEMISKKDSGEESKTSQSTAEKKAGDVSQTTQISATAATRLYDKPPFTAAASVYDPIMVYQNALTLYQLVALLNRSIKDAALREGYDPYIVTLQITLMPYSHDLKYDAYSTISFFSGSKMEGAATPTKVESDSNNYNSFVEYILQWALKQPYNDIKTLKEEIEKTEFFKITYSKENKENKANELAIKLYEMYKNKLRNLLGGKSCQNPFILPLLATDNLEAGSDVRCVNEIRQLSLALVALVQGFGASAGIDKTKQFMSSVAGNDLNSLLTLGRLSDNTIQARLGAMLQPNKNNFSMVPRTHNISLLVMAPKTGLNSNTTNPSIEIKSIRAISRTIFRDTKTGDMLNTRTERIINNNLLRILNSYNIIIPTDESVNKICQTLLNSVQENDYDLFVQVLNFQFNAKNIDLSYESLWVDLASLWIGGQYTQITFDLPSRLQIEWPDMKQWLICNDDMKTKMTVLLKGGNNIFGEDLKNASLEIKLPKKEEPPAKNNGSEEAIVIYADSIEILNQSNILIAFPTLKTFGDYENGKLVGFKLNLNNSMASPHKFENLFLNKLTAAAEPPTPKPNYIRSIQTYILSDKGDGWIDIIISKIPNNKLFIKNTNAVLKSSNPSGIIDNGKEGLYLILKEGQVRLNYENMIPGTKIKIEIVDEKKAVIESYEYPVIQKV